MGPRMEMRRRMPAANSLFEVRTIIIIDQGGRRLSMKTPSRAERVTRAALRMKIGLWIRDDI
jgi:hypothetical protein